MLSGGQKKLVGLAKLLVIQPDVLLLDEPDNHLDLAGKAYLERFIRGYNGAVIIVSHDRYLLDLVVDEIAELEDGRLTHYPGNYSEYAFEKQTRLLRQQQLYQAQQKEITRLEQAAKRLLTWGQVYDNDKFVRRGQNILKRLEQDGRIEKPMLERQTHGPGAERLARQQQGAGDHRSGQSVSARHGATATRTSSWPASTCSSGAASGWGWSAPTARASRCSSASSWARKRPAAARSRSAPASRSATMPRSTRRSTTSAR